MEPRVAEVNGERRQRHPDFPRELFNVEEARRRHADDREWAIAHPDRRSENRRGGTEDISPEPLTDDSDGPRAPVVFLFREKPTSQHHRDAERVEIVGAHEARLDVDDDISMHDRTSASGMRGKRDKGLIVPTEIQVFRYG